MARRHAAQMHTMGGGSRGGPRVRMLGGGINQYGLRTLVTQLIRQELGSDGSAPPAGSLAYPASPGEAPLSAREREVLGMLVRGLPNKEIARLLFIAERTVKWHANAIYHKLDVTNRTEAVGAALRRGLVSLDAIAPPSRAA